MNDELKQIIIGILIFGLILFWVIKTTNDNSNLSPNIEDRQAQYK